MHKQGEEVHLTDTEASGGSKEGVVRWVLAGGLLLAIIGEKGAVPPFEMVDKPLKDLWFANL